MHKLLLTLIALCTIHSAVAMNLTPAKKPRTHEFCELSAEQTNHLGIPRKLVLLNLEEPITDEWLLELNPEWRPLKSSSYDAKSKIMGAALEYFHYPEGYRIKRSLIALALCIGGNVNQRTKSDSSAGKMAFSKHDFPLAKYVLAKGAYLHNEIGLEDASLESVKTVELAELLIRYGAKISENTLSCCCKDEYPASLMQFYLDHGAKPNLDLTPLHLLAVGKVNVDQLEKGRMLLRAGLDVAHKDAKGNTMAHMIAYQASYRRRMAWINLLIDHYLDQHRAFLEFLWHLKNNFPNFYRIKDMRKLCFNELSPMRKLHALLSIKNGEGHMAYDITPNEELNPATCTYEKLRFSGKNIN